MKLTADERKNARLTDESLDVAARTLREAGFVVLDDAFDPAFVADVARAYDEELERDIARRGGLDAVNAKAFGHNHLGMHLPLVSPFSDPAVVANPFAVQIMERALGEDFACSFYHSNTAYPGSEHQPIHRDYGQPFGTELGVATPATHLVLNVPLCDFTEENGSTEVWPGTHLVVDRTAGEGKDLAARAALLPSVRTNVPAGSLILRDLRTWHRGMPNRSDRARAMLALVYTRGWVYDKPNTLPAATWDAWPERVRRIFRRNTVVAAT